MTSNPSGEAASRSSTIDVGSLGPDDLEARARRPAPQHLVPGVLEVHPAQEEDVRLVIDRPAPSPSSASSSERVTRWSPYPGCRQAAALAGWIARNWVRSITGPSAALTCGTRDPTLGRGGSRAEGLPEARIRDARDDRARPARDDGRARARARDRRASAGPAAFPRAAARRAVTRRGSWRASAARAAAAGSRATRRRSRWPRSRTRSRGRCSRCSAWSRRTTRASRTRAAASRGSGETSRGRSQGVFETTTVADLAARQQKMAPAGSLICPGELPVQPR